jgi:hypothetical protein
MGATVSIPMRVPASAALNKTVAANVDMSTRRQTLKKALSTSMLTQWEHTSKQAREITTGRLLWDGMYTATAPVVTATAPVVTATTPVVTATTPVQPDTTERVGVFANQRGAVCAWSWKRHVQL